MTIERRSQTSAVRFALFACAVAAGAACTLPSNESEGHGPTGSVQIALTNVPAGVGCLRLTLVGPTTVQRSFDVAPNQTSILNVDDLPPGPMTLSADAFTTACAGISPTAIGAWISPKQTTTILTGGLTFVTLTMERSGQACVSVDFPQDAFTTDAGTPAAPAGPTTTITAGPTGVVGSTSASFTFNASTTDATMQCSLDTAPFTTCTSPISYTGLAFGAHTFRARAVSPTCVFGAIATRAWTAGPTLTTATSGGGSISGTGISCGADCTEAYAPGTAVTLTATPNAGYNFTGWSGACTGTGACNLTISANTSVTANFAVNTFNLTVTKAGAGSGAVSSSPAGINCGSVCTASYPLNTSVMLTAIPATGSTFAGWSGACSGTGTCMVNVASNVNVTATFN